MRNRFLVLAIVALLLASYVPVRAGDNIYIPLAANSGSSEAPTATATTAPPEPTATPNMVATSVAATLTALAPTATSTNTSTPTASPTVTPTATDTAVPPTATNTATATETPEIIPPHETATGTPPWARTPTPTATAAPAMTYYFGFDNGSTMGWNSSEEAYKYVELLTANFPTLNGSAGSLKVSTEMSTNGPEVLGHTEVTIVFKPGVVANPGPKDLRGKGVSMQVYFPHELFVNGGRVCGYMFIRDTEFNPQNTKMLCYDSSQADQWQYIQLVDGVEGDGHIDQNFDSDKVLMAGFRMEAIEGLEHTGWSISLEDVRIGFSAN